MNKSFVLADVKAIDTDDPNGAFVSVLSAPTLDRDGEIIDKGAFEPLPESIPIHAFHDFSDPVGRGAPFYEDDVLKVRGVFASTPRAQEIRTLVAESVITNMSVGFMSAEREAVDDVPHVTRAELLEGSFVSIPSNRDAAVLAAKEYAAKAGARNSSTDAGRLQQIHDLAVANGATCETKTDDPEDEPKSAPEVDTKSTDPEEPAAAPAAAEPPADVALQDQVLAEIARTSAALLRS